jgi:hypothetical protein
MKYPELIELFRTLARAYTVDAFARALKTALSPEQINLLIERLEI